jgi:hypothetical protein
MTAGEAAFAAGMSGDAATAAKRAATGGWRQRPRTKRWYLTEYSVKTKKRRNLMSFRYAPFFVHACEASSSGGSAGAAADNGGMMDTETTTPFVVAATENMLVVWNVREKALQSKVRDQASRCGMFLGWRSIPL